MGSAYPANVRLSLEDFETRESDDELILIVTEALSNALRHSHAENVEVSLGREDGDLVLRVVDDGAGFDQSVLSEGGMGIANMRTRARGLGGDVAIEGRPGKGTTVEVRFPVK
jgi:signal transduction histidine kinase